MSSRKRGTPTSNGAPVHPALERKEPSDSAPNLLATTLAEAAKRESREPSWLRDRRRGAIAWLETRGFPLPKEESWRFTPIRSLLHVPYELGAANGASPGSAPSHGFDATPLVLVNGRLVDALTQVPGVEVQRLSDVIARDPGHIEPYLGALAPVADGFSAVNTALFE